MQRREFLKSAAAVAAPASKTRPNFVFLIADDLTHNALGFIEATRLSPHVSVQTPNLDRLAKQGVTFTHCFHQGSWQPAVCVASRTMLNTGLTAFRAQKQVEQTALWGETLGRAGYQTHMVGKWHLSKGTLDRSFQQHGKIAGGMFESDKEAYGRPSPGNTWTPWDTSRGGQWQHASEWQGPAAEGIKHSAQIWAENAAAVIRGKAASDEAFFLYVGFTSPHDPRQAPKEFVDRYPVARVEAPENYLPEHPFDQGDHKVRDELLAPFPRTREAVRLHRAEYYAHITFLDAQVGQILDALEASGKASNTYVIFTADHGLAVGQHGLMGKQNLYDHSVRIPLIVRGPGVAGGRRVEDLVYQHSMFATTCELAGVDVSKSVEFPSLRAAVMGGSAPRQDAMFCFYRDFQRSVRTREFKLIVYPQVGKTQLFDLRKDPWETRDLSEERGMAGTKAALLERLRGMQKELGDTARS